MACRNVAQVALLASPAHASMLRFPLGQDANDGSWLLQLGQQRLERSAPTSASTASSTGLVHAEDLVVAVHLDDALLRPGSAPVGNGFPHQSVSPKRVPRARATSAWLPHVVRPAAAAWGIAFFRRSSTALPPPPAGGDRRAQRARELLHEVAAPPACTAPLPTWIRGRARAWLRSSAERRTSRRRRAPAARSAGNALGRENGRHRSSKDPVQEVLGDRSRGRRPAGPGTRPGSARRSASAYPVEARARRRSTSSSGFVTATWSKYW